MTSKKARKAIGAARVDCRSGGSATTALDGGYRIASVPAATYVCTASATGYRPKSQSVTVTAGKETTANFALTPA